MKRKVICSLGPRPKTNPSADRKRYTCRVRSGDEARLSVTNLSSENNLQMFQLNAPVVFRVKVMMTGGFSRNVSKLFSELKLVTDNLPSFMQWPLKDSVHSYIS